jgi:hypothetical protein
MHPHHLNCRQEVLDRRVPVCIILGVDDCTSWAGDVLPASYRDYHPLHTGFEKNGFMVTSTDANFCSGTQPTPT